MKSTFSVARSTQRSTSAAPEAKPFKTIRMSVGQHVVATDTFGEGPPVLLIHGIPGWRGMWRNCARRLEGCCVIAPDLLGFGESSEPSGDFHAEGQAEMVIALMRRLVCGPVHLVGFDFGGPTAVLVYRRAPELVASLTLAATNVFTDTPIPAALQLVRPPVLGDLIARALFGRLGLAAMWVAAVARREVFRFADYREMLRFPNGITWTRRVFQSSLRNLHELYAPVQATLPDIHVPCRVIWGDRDPFFPLSVGERTAACIPGATLVRLQGCGHFLPEEDPDGFASVIRDLVHSTSALDRAGGCDGDAAIDFR